MNEYSSPTAKRIIGTVALSFLFTFIMSRLVVYLVLGHWLPNFFLNIKGVHIHHFTYGVVILVIVGFYLILKRPLAHSRAFLYATLIYGVGLGLTFDEFGMWIRLQDDYWVRQSYDAIVIIGLMLLNMAYYRSISNLLKYLTRLFFRKNKQNIKPIEAEDPDLI